MVVLLSAPDTLRRLDREARRRGLDLRRVAALRFRPSRGAPPTLARRRRAAVDTAIVTSRHAAGRLLSAWCRPLPGGRPVELWAAGPGSAERLRRLGYRRVRRGDGLGGEGIVRALGPRPRRIVHLRSDLAGSRLARALRARGHRVTEVVAYRVEADTARLRRERPLLRRAAAWVVTSPSVISAVRQVLGDSLRDVPVIVLGERTATAAARAGFRRVQAVGPLSPQRFARRLVRAVDDAKT